MLHLYALGFRKISGFVSPVFSQRDRGVIVRDLTDDILLHNRCPTPGSLGVKDIPPSE
ncbi:hypothetical protein TNCV_3754561, partial [Trichonephila clavipes]